MWPGSSQNSDDSENRKQSFGQFSGVPLFLDTPRVNGTCKADSEHEEDVDVELLIRGIILKATKIAIPPGGPIAVSFNDCNDGKYRFPRRSAGTDRPIKPKTTTPPINAEKQPANTYKNITGLKSQLKYERDTEAKKKSRLNKAATVGGRKRNVKTKFINEPSLNKPLNEIRDPKESSNRILQHTELGAIEAKAIIVKDKNVFIFGELMDEERSSTFNSQYSFGADWPQKNGTFSCSSLTKILEDCMSLSSQTCKKMREEIMSQRHPSPINTRSLQNIPDVLSVESDTYKSIPTKWQKLWFADRVKRDKQSISQLHRAFSGRRQNSSDDESI